MKGLKHTYRPYSIITRCFKTSREQEQAVPGLPVESTAPRARQRRRSIDLSKRSLPPCGLLVSSRCLERPPPLRAGDRAAAGADKGFGDASLERHGLRRDGPRGLRGSPRPAREGRRQI